MGVVSKHENSIQHPTTLNSSSLFLAFKIPIMKVTLCFTFFITMVYVQSLYLDPFKDGAAEHRPRKNGECPNPMTFTYCDLCCDRKVFDDSIRFELALQTCYHIYLKAHCNACCLGVWRD